MYIIPTSWSATPHPLHLPCCIQGKRSGHADLVIIVASGAIGPMGVTSMKPVSLTSLPSLPMQTSEIASFDNVPRLSAPEARVSNVSFQRTIRRRLCLEGLFWMPGCETADVQPDVSRFAPGSL